MEAWKIFLAVYVATNTMIFCVLALRKIGVPGSTDYILPSFSDIREETSMNIFGCVLVFILLLICCPIGYIFKFIYWLCHI